MTIKFLSIESQGKGRDKTGDGNQTCESYLMAQQTFWKDKGNNKDRELLVTKEGIWQTYYDSIR